MSKYTIFTIKKDALKRGLKNIIISDISKYYDVKKARNAIISKETAVELKKYEWQNHWQPYPSPHVRELCCRYESGKILILLCRINIDREAIRFGKKLKGASYLPFLCSPDSIRGKYSDQKLIPFLFKDKFNRTFIKNKRGKIISTVPNIIHSVNNLNEFSNYFDRFFRDYKAKDLPKLK